MALIEPNDLLISSTGGHGFSVTNGIPGRFSGQGPNDFVSPENDVFHNVQMPMPAVLPAMPMRVPFPTLNQLEVEMDINYHGTHELEQKEEDSWIDLYLAEDYSLKAGEFKYLCLGISMELPRGFEAIMAPRSSTFKRYGILQANSIGVIDNAYNGDDDIWYFPAYCTRNVELKKNDRICQFRLIESQPKIIFKSVESLGNEARGGLGHSGR